MFILIFVDDIFQDVDICSTWMQYDGKLLYAGFAPATCMANDILKLYWKPSRLVAA